MSEDHFSEHSSDGAGETGLSPQSKPSDQHRAASTQPTATVEEPTPHKSEPKKVVKRDPRFPRLPLKAHAWFREAHLQKLQEAAGRKVVMTKDAQHDNMEDWKKLPPEERKTYLDQASKDDQRFIEEFRDYVVTGRERAWRTKLNSDARCEKTVTKSASKSKKTKKDGEYIDEAGSSDDSAKKKKKPKKEVLRDPQAPIHTKGSYIFFLQETRDKAIADGTYANFSKPVNGRVEKPFSIQVGVMWNALPPEQKQKYYDLADEDKLRFDRETQEYIQSGRKEAWEQVVRNGKRHLSDNPRQEYQTRKKQYEQDLETVQRTGLAVLDVGVVPSKSSIQFACETYLRECELTGVTSISARAVIARIENACHLDLSEIHPVINNILKACVTQAKQRARTPEPEINSEDDSDFSHLSTTPVSSPPPE
ncbi:hypothetical protein BLNAU_2426 [Blattamonas nauphoetae]|uniref:HMG box domain-containing protein n=1 Tax=Blattamonas nauphoetae TaxID=2049346 RepID=A0ABQ9YFQ2_9EUKA|nr:hypothetical protein BLNAU_2426 [Blattamonas nauphoetae]